MFGCRQRWHDACGRMSSGDAWDRHQCTGVPGVIAARGYRGMLIESPGAFRHLRS